MINNLAIIKKINTTKSLLIETKKFIEDVKLLCSLDYYRGIKRTYLFRY